VLQCVAVCCSVLQCVAVCCSVLQSSIFDDIVIDKRQIMYIVAVCVAVCCSMLHCVLQRVLPCVAVCYRMLPCVAVCCSVAVCCRVLQCVAVRCSVRTNLIWYFTTRRCAVLQYVAVCCNLLQYVCSNLTWCLKTHEIDEPKVHSWKAVYLAAVCVAACCSVLHWVAVRYHVLQCAECVFICV